MEAVDTIRSCASIMVFVLLASGCGGSDVATPTAQTTTVVPTTTVAATTTVVPTTTKASTVDVDRCRTAMKEVKRVLYASDNNVFDNAFRVTLRVCGNRRTWQSVAREVGGSIDGMLTAACMLNGNTAVCKN